MITENLSTLKIHKLTKEQYERELEAGRIDENALYLTPDEEVDLSGMVRSSDIFEEKSFGWTEFDYTYASGWEGVPEEENGSITDNQISAGFAIYTIHCAGSTLGFNFSRENNNNDLYIIINGTKYFNSGSIPLTYMENDIIVECNMGGFIFTNMVKQSIKILNNVYTKAETDIAIANASHLKRVIVAELPAIGDINTIYMVSSTTTSENNIYLEYMYLNNAWEVIGSSEVDLTDYVKNTDYASSETGGVIKVKSTYGINMDSSIGFAYVTKATNEEIDAKTNRYKPIVPANLEYAVKSVGDDYYATTEEISALENSIKNTTEIANNAILYTEQNLTEEQKAQARANIGITSQGEENTKEEEIQYYYDGNANDEDDVWVYNYPKTAKVFYKAGDIPENGKINLVGGYINITVPEDTYWDYSFEITEEMLEASVDYNGWVISANVNGLTQILYQNFNTNDVTPIAVVVICTKAGQYNIAFNGWGEELTFAEKGIYLLDNRSFGGNKYVKSFSCTIINSPNSSTDSLSNPTNYDGKEIQVFSKGICIGDSITEGVFNHSDGEVVIKNYSYPKLLQRMTNIEVVNAGVAGLTSKTWYEASLNSDTQYGRWVNNEWMWSTNIESTDTLTVSTALDYSGYDFAVIHLGINDIGMMGSATLEATIATFETNINNIISKLKMANTGIKIFLCTIIPCYAVSGNTAYQMLNDKIREMADVISDVFLIDLNKYSDCSDGTSYENQHLTAIGYHKMASEISSLISYTISQNLEDFKWVQFIGTNYTP